MFTSFRSIIVKGVGRSLWLQPYRHQSPFNPCFKNVAFHILRLVLNASRKNKRGQEYNQVKEISHIQ